MNKNSRNDKDPEEAEVSGDIQDETSLLRGQPDVRADTKAQQGTRTGHRYTTVPKNTSSLQFSPCKDTEEMVEFDRLEGEDVFKTVNFRKKR